MHVDPKQHETGPSEEEEELLCTEELLGGGGVLEEEGAEGADEDEGVALQVGQPQPLPSVSQPLSRGSPIVVPGGHPLHDASQHDRDPVSSPNVCLHHSHRLVAELLEALLVVLRCEEGVLPALELGGGGGPEKEEDREEEGCEEGGGCEEEEDREEEGDEELEDVEDEEPSEGLEEDEE